jgi:hypothetical protein
MPAKNSSGQGSMFALVRSALTAQATGIENSAYRPAEHGGEQSRESWFLWNIMLFLSFADAQVSVPPNPEETLEERLLFS